MLGNDLSIRIPTPDNQQEYVLDTIEQIDALMAMRRPTLPLWDMTQEQLCEWAKQQNATLVERTHPQT